ncbi:MAG TPA: FHA domain-containing protein [Noviherbaspirillum sp.]|uniref:FHA domain-containing protein n=1 Tax=Noviherbaspirillum sp. TaxID=1926288 RepID=UPI002B471DA3|nr:FHA domain-containing protein [Noviherbaspirillum sp.]HJV88619.1 FHA domain-containing protein [Noviherbaspirillum sp.]
MASNQATIADTQAAAGQEFDIVLKPVSHPELGSIRIDENLFAIGRTEPPFDAYPPEVVADLSRRHARIFSEQGGVYIADLDSKNGTTVNGVNVQQKITRLSNGDLICFGGTLSFKVHLGVRAEMRGRPAKLVSLTLTPERGDLGLQPIVVTRFPFLVSKADEVFSRYKNDYPHQVNYISRRHAHIFLKGGSPFVEDLGSTNGTFVAGKRLDEHAVPLEDGDVLAFGGHHFVYKVSLQKEESDPTITRLSQAVRAPERPTADADKTTFVAAADSFLDIFCVDHAPQQEDELNAEAPKPQEEDGDDKHAPRGRAWIFLSGLAEAFSGGEHKEMAPRVRRAGAIVAALIAVLAAALYFNGSGKRDLKEMMADGDYAHAAEAADTYLAQDPDNAEIKAMGTEALLKAAVPGWLALLKSGNFRGADAALADMNRRGRHNSDMQPVLAEMAWMGRLENFIASRGGPDAPVRIYVDEDRIKGLLRQWDDDPPAHQRAFAAIAAAVPEFRDPYAQALSHLRKLQSDEAVLLAAIDRLKGAIGDALKQDQPENLDSVLKDYAEKYPRLGNLDAVRQDVRRYTEAESLVRERNLARLVSLQEKAKFSTPPFQEKFSALMSGNRYPPAEVVQQYQTVRKAWQAGDSGQAFAGLQKMGEGAWGDAAKKELQHKKEIVDAFAALQKSRNTKGYEERLLAFYSGLDPDEDVYFVRAVAPDIGRVRDKALDHARELAGRAQARWQQYRERGPIEGGQRLETRISDGFRTQARALSEARADANESLRIYAQLKAEAPAGWKKMREEIDAEADAQRKGLLELRNVLEPGLLKAKLALLASEDK